MVHNSPEPQTLEINISGGDMQTASYQALQKAINLMTAEEIEILLSLAQAVTDGRSEAPAVH